MIIALIGILIVAYIMKGKWNILNLGFADLGVYGLIIFIYTIIQQALSITNNNYWIPKLAEKAKKKPKTNIQVVGYL
jgi:hypothetical protein